MPDLREQLQQLLQGRVCLMGLGNVLYGDDGFGVRLVEELKSEVRSPKSEGNPKSEGRTEDVARLFHAFEAGAPASCRLTRSEQPKPATCRRSGLSAFPDDGKPVRPDRSSSDFELRPSFGLRTSDFGFRSHVLIAGTTPERHIGRVADECCDHVIFLDAVEFGGAPGSVVLLNSDEMAARFPQVSTHKLSLGLLAKQIEANGESKAWLLGVQPESLRPGEQLSPTVSATLQLLLALVREVSLVGCAVLCAPQAPRTPDSATSRRAEDCAPYQQGPEVMA